METNQKVDQYCHIYVTQGGWLKLFSYQMKIFCGNTGSVWETKFKSDESFEVDSDGYLVRFKMPMELVNYLASDGWEMVNSFTAIDSGTHLQYLQFILKKKFDKVDTIQS